MANIEFKTKADVEALERAAGVVRKAEESHAVAQDAVNTAEAAAVEEPTYKTFEAAKKARATLADLQRDVELSHAHAGSVQALVDSNEHRAIVRELARLEANRTAELVDEESKLLAVTIGTMSAELHNRILSRRDQQRTELEDLNALRRRVGQPVQERPGDEGTDKAFASLVRIAWTAQAGSGWEGGFGYFTNPLFALSAVSGTSLAGVVQEVGDHQVEELRKRVAARRAALEKGASTSSIAKAAVAAVGALVVFGMTMATGG